MLFCLISSQSRIGCQFHVRKIRIILIFSGVNDFRKKYQQKQLGVVVKYVLVQFLQKTYILTKICCALLAFTLPDLVWFLWHIIKQIFHAFFCLILKLCTHGNIIFNSASRRWILITLWLISDIKQKSMEYLLNIGKR